MNRRSVPADQRLRRLLKAGRRASGNLSQKTAAQRAGISLVRWQQIESGTAASAPADTLAAMFAAVGITAVRLHDEGYPDIAQAVEELDDALTGRTSVEEHLAATPGATSEEISALQAVWQVLRAKRTAEPFEEKFHDSSRRTRRSTRTPPEKQPESNYLA